ncbi:MAG: hypothetical protein ACSLFH_00010 [Desulfuromonadales bacterium]
MFQIIEKKLSVRFPRRSPARIVVPDPTTLEQHDLFFRLTNPEQNWQTAQSILKLVIEGHDNLKKINFIFLAKTSLPYEYLKPALPSSTRCSPIEHAALN